MSDAEPPRDTLEPFPLDGPTPSGLLACLARHPEVAQPWQRFANELLAHGALPPRWREIVVLRVAWRRRCRYVLGGHGSIALRSGLARHELKLVRDGATAEGWTSVEAALLAATDDLLDHGLVAPGTWAVLTGALDLRQQVELPMLVGQYVLVSMVVGCLGIQPEGEPPDLVESPPPGPTPEGAS